MTRLFLQGWATVTGVAVLLMLAFHGPHLEVAGKTVVSSALVLVPLGIADVLRRRRKQAEKDRAAFEKFDREVSEEMARIRREGRGT